MNGPATQKPITMNLSIPIRPKRKAPGTAAKHVVRIGSEAAFNECCGELSMCLYERPDVGLLWPFIAIVLTRNLGPQYASVEAERHQASTVLRFDIVRVSHYPDGVAV